MSLSQYINLDWEEKSLMQNLNETGIKKGKEVSMTHAEILEDLDALKFKDDEKE